MIAPFTAQAALSRVKKTRNQLAKRLKGRFVIRRLRTMRPFFFFFGIIGAGYDNKVTAFEEACKFDTQYLVSYRERKYGRVREILYLIKFLSVNELLTLSGPECKSFEETN